MNDKTTCGDCRHWDAYDPDGDGDRGECRRLASKRDRQGNGRWPITIEVEWCRQAEHQEGTT